MITAMTKSLADKRAGLKDDDKGFTLIELLVVVLIIGILAAIAIPVFLGQQNSAKDAAAKSDLANAKIAMIAYASANDGTYFTGDATAAAATGATGLADFGYVVSSKNAVTFTAGGAGVFCVQETSATGSDFGVSNLADAPAEGTCAAGVFTKKP